MLYLDTSVIVSLLTAEAASERVDRFVRSRRPDELAFSGWSDTEFANALARKVRMREIEETHAAEAELEWARWRESLIALEVRDSAFQAAARFIARRDRSLRSGDALHIAIAAEYRCSMVTLDLKLSQAAPELGVPVAAL